jgi:alpha-L-arabinofuranosidase
VLDNKAPGTPVSRIAIAPARSLGTIDRKIFGGFVEHLGRCIYGGLYQEDSAAWPASIRAAVSVPVT